MGGRPGEVSTNWVAKRLGLDVQTIRRWCRENGIACRPQRGMRKPDGTRHIVRYWILLEDAKKLIEDE
jgi:hypothetical protein